MEILSPDTIFLKIQNEINSSIALIFLLNTCMMFAYKKLLYCISIAGLILTMTSCSPEDADIKTWVDAQLADMPGVQARVSKGIVTLTGEFPDEHTRKETEADVKTVTGVRSVINETGVKHDE